MVISHTWLTTTQIAYKSSLMKVAESLACVKYIMKSIRGHFGIMGV
jgi:hypothetical protein